MAVNVAEAKARPPRLLAKVEAGEEIIITRGNTPSYDRLAFAAKTTLMC